MKKTLLFASVIAVSGMVAAPAFADTIPTTTSTTTHQSAIGQLVNRFKKNHPKANVKGALEKKGAAGEVTSISGSSILLNAFNPGHKKDGTATTTPVTATVDSTTVFKKDGKAATIADVTAGEYVLVSGTRTGDIVAAKEVRIFTKTDLGKGHRKARK